MVKAELETLKTSNDKPYLHKSNDYICSDEAGYREKGYGTSQTTGGLFLT